MSITNTLYNLIPDYFKTDLIDNVLEREEGVLFFDVELKIFNTWIDGVKYKIDLTPMPDINNTFDYTFDNTFN